MFKTRDIVGQASSVLICCRRCGLVDIRRWVPGSSTRFWNSWTTAQVRGTETDRRMRWSWQRGYSRDFVMNSSVWSTTSTAVCNVQLSATWHEWYQQRHLYTATAAESALCVTDRAGVQPKPALTDFLPAAIRIHIFLATFNGLQFRNPCKYMDLLICLPRRDGRLSWLSFWSIADSLPTAIDRAVVRESPQPQTDILTTEPRRQIVN